eukprot:TRINITY_DN6050_c0_g1_i4.p1 TRINITY_DN6050_c0_g1~~TRINITY_DN6050_c0_g1_i4.p1  ORF type:complete len:305 (-),score=30.37 TRINITY_DN6050_c0_g1_i4:288-1118(-)
MKSWLEDQNKLNKQPHLFQNYKRIVFIQKANMGIFRYTLFFSYLVCQVQSQGVSDSGEYSSGAQSVAPSLGAVEDPGMDTSVFAPYMDAFEPPLGEVTASEPVALYTSDYEDGDNLGAYLLDNREELTLESSEIATFLSLINETDVRQETCMLGSVTVLAPSEDAFEEFLETQNTTMGELMKFISNVEKLQEVLRIHIVRAQIQEVMSGFDYATLNPDQTLKVSVEGEDPYAIQTNSNSAMVQGVVDQAVDCGDFSIAAVVISDVLVPNSNTQSSF